MRILRALDASSNPKIAIWPFEDIENAKVGVVEIYPAAFYRMAGRARPTKRQVLQGAHCQIISDTLQFFGSEYDANISDSIDAMDALISAAAICSISKQNHAFSVPNGKNDFAKEGWIFGIPFGGVA